MDYRLELDKALEALKEIIEINDMEGKVYEVTEEAPNYDTWYCPVCGSHVEQESNYCPHCRAKLGWEILWSETI